MKSWATVLATALGLCCFRAGISQDSRPNVVVILTDDQGWGDLSLHGNSNLSTPHLDALAQGGASFDYFFVCPVCSPTRAEFLTGRYHPRAGVYSTSAGGERMDLDEITIADHFKAAGYATAAFGKWHNGMQFPYHPNGRGFDEFYGFCSGHWGDYFAPLLERNGQLTRGSGFIIDDLTTAAMAFIENQRESPFFIYLPYNTPHSPMQVPDRWWQTFKDHELPLRHRDEQENMDHTRAALAMCENIDWNVGRLLHKLDELNLTDNTIVVFFHDNGPNGARWNGDMKGRKGSTDEGGVRSPLFVRWPRKIRSGKAIPQIAAAIDLLPTLTDLAGVARQADVPLDGVSLTPLLFEEHPDWPDRMIVSHWRGSVSVRNQNYRLDHQGQLFDMLTDPGQRHNVRPQNVAIAEQLAAEATRWKREVLVDLGDDRRPFIVGHPGCRHTQLPARDGVVQGGIQRSNRFPNCSYFTHWTRLDDAITWHVEVPAAGKFAVDIYYTCADKDLGSTIQLEWGQQHLQAKVLASHDPPIFGAEHDRVPRVESYVKDFKPLRMGVIELKPGVRELKLRAIQIAGSHVMDFRMLLFTRLD